MKPYLVSPPDRLPRRSRKRTVPLDALAARIDVAKQMIDRFTRECGQTEGAEEKAYIWAKYFLKMKRMATANQAEPAS